MQYDVLFWAVIICAALFGTLSGLVKAPASSSSPGRTTRWQFSKSKAATFSVLWKIWLALAGGAAVLISGTGVDTWYYAAGLINILVSVWTAFDVQHKQNILASRDIPIFTMKRGGAE